MIARVHVYPLKDKVDHLIDDSADCICGPESIPVEREDGSMGWIEVHNALDGREIDEQSAARRDSLIEEKKQRIKSVP